MENMINFGIDLGTTNSAIAKFVNGEVTVYSNPGDYGRNTLPSVIGFKKDKIFVGVKAKELLERDPKSVAGTFKRKMGTTESFKIKAINESKTPIELSAIILKELKTFLPPSEKIEAAVITIPASFDMIQSNATKEAGLMAGFKQVVLLQEPIAASLAYANMKKDKEMKDGQWLVYDLGGGTFDAALIRIKDGEMRVLDHEGDNFLGGADFDRLIIDKLVLPKLNEKYEFPGLEDDMKSASGKYNAKYLSLIQQAEEAKILLSSKSSAEIEVRDLTDENEEAIDEEITITRSEFNALIREYVDNSIDMVKKVLTRHSLTPGDVQFTLMVGGSTYIPYVRQRVEEVLQIPINCTIDPTTAVAVGAAYYASTKPIQFEKTDAPKKNVKISIKAAYAKTSREKEELFSAKITGDINGLYYRITREDGGFNTGLKKLAERISDDLPLLENSYNFFKLTVYDSQNNVIETDMDMIGINSGFGISGQPLPHDICVEVDDDEHPGETKLFMVFEKNTILPTKRTLTRVLNKTLIKGDDDDCVVINVLEGPHNALPEANHRVGFIRISGRNLKRDVSKGSDIELTFAVSESRELTVSVYFNMADQEFKETFTPQYRLTRVDTLQNEIDHLYNKLEDEIEEATQQENYEVVQELTRLKKEVTVISEDADALVQDDVTDKRYQLEDQKRKLAQELDNATKDKRLVVAKNEYLEEKERCLELINENGNDYERKRYNDIVALEAGFLNTSSIVKIREKTQELHHIVANILWRMPDYLTPLFRNLVQHAPRMNNQSQARSLIDAGKLALDNENWERLGDINSSLIGLLPAEDQREVTTRIGF